MSKKRLFLPGMIICGIAVMFLVVAGMLLYWLNAPVDLYRPARNIPQPNAYDYYLSAGDQVVFEEQCTEALYPGSSQTPSSAEIRALKKPPKGIPQAYTIKRPYTLAEKTALIKANAPVFKILHEGLKYDSISPPETIGPDLTHYSKLYRITKLINIKIQVHNESGEYNQAVKTYLNGIKFRNDCLNSIPLRGYDESLSFLRIDSSIMVDKLNSSQAREAAGRLEYLQSKSVAFRDIMQESRYVDLSFSLAEQAGSTNPVLISQSPDSVYVCLKFAFNKRLELNRLAAVWDNAMEYASKPYPEFIKLRIPDDIQSVEDPRSICYVKCYYEGIRCTNDLLMLRLALRAYRLDNSKYPVKLDDLSPHYVNKIPGDPFALKGHYKYKLNGNSYKLYSIGPDCKDDGGRAFFIGSRLPDIDQNGDLVVECK